MGDAPLRAKQVSPEQRAWGNQMLGQQGAAAGGGDNALRQFKTALARAKPEIGSASRVRAGTPVQQALRATLTAALAEMTAAHSARNYAGAMPALARAEQAARRLNLSEQAATQATQRQVTAQTEQYNTMQATARQVIGTYFNPNAASGSARISEESLSAGKEFKAYTTALASLERAKGRARSEVVGAAAVRVGDAAQAYLEHFENDLSDRQKSDPKSLRKKQICEEGLKAARHYQMALDMQSLPAPRAGQPWSDGEQIRANQLRAQVSFETGYKKGASLKSEGGGGLSASYWVESKPPGQAKADKSFIFKPMEGAESEFDEPPAASVAKEALASRGAKLVQAQTGIDLGVPESSVATIGNYALDLPGGRANGAQVGSLQQFEPTDGELGAQKASTIRTMPAAECQRMAINDIINLNVDRHPGNFLVRNGPDGPTMVPIDHGNTLPPLRDFQNQRSLRDNIGGVYDGFKLGAVKNVLLTMPGSHEPFAQDMADRLSLLDPQAVADGMAAHLDSLDRANPGLNAAAAVDRDSLTLSKRVMQFLKKAAPSLSPAAIQIAIAQHYAAFADFGRDIEAAAVQIIADMQPKAPGYAEFFTAPTDRRTKILKELERNGWAPADQLMMRDPVAALKLFKAGTRKGAQDPAAAAGGVDLAAALRNNIAGLLDEARGQLADARPADQGRLAGQIAAFAVEAPATADEAASLERRVRAFSDEMLDHCLDFLKERVAELFDRQAQAFRTARPKDDFTKCYQAFLHEVGPLRSLSHAKLLVEDMQRQITIDRTGA